ncbi:MAG: cell wall hydrolase [Lachnospiraceae bacterium]|nr:cell wall hydrolase [Lachnospiraceae bacterium]
MRSGIRAAAFLMVMVLGLVFVSEYAVPEGKIVMATSTRERIDQAEREKQELENRHNETKQDIDRLKGEQNTLKGKLNNLNAQLTEVAGNLEDLEDQIDRKEQEITDTQAALEEAKIVEADQYADMITRVRKMYEKNDTSYVNMVMDSVMDAGSFADALYTADGFEKIAAYDKRKLAEFKENRRLIEEHEALLQQEKTELDNLHLKAETEKNKISGLIGQTSGSISAYAGEISQAQQEAEAYEAQIKQKEADLEALWEQLRKEIALSQAAAKGEWRDISEVTFAEGDRYLLANLIYCEAGAEPYAGQLAVGSVVINRVLSGSYPDSVVGVIYQNKQFSPVASGRLELALAANRATQSCYQAADEAMSGVSNVGNCVYFRTPIEGLTGISIGGHIFY